MAISYANVVRNSHVATKGSKGCATKTVAQQSKTTDWAKCPPKVGNPAHNAPSPTEPKWSREEYLARKKVWDEKEFRRTCKICSQNNQKEFMDLLAKSEEISHDEWERHLQDVARFLSRGTVSEYPKNVCEQIIVCLTPKIYTRLCTETPELTENFMCNLENCAVVKELAFILVKIKGNKIHQSVRQQKRGNFRDLYPAQTWCKPHEWDVLYTAWFCVVHQIPIVTVFEGNGLHAFLLRESADLIAALLGWRKTSVRTTSLRYPDTDELAQKNASRGRTDPIYSAYPLGNNICVEEVDAVTAIRESAAKYGSRYLLWTAWIPLGKRLRMEGRGVPEWIVQTVAGCTGDVFAVGSTTTFAVETDNWFPSRTRSPERTCYMLERFPYEDMHSYDYGYLPTTAIRVSLISYWEQWYNDFYTDEVTSFEHIESSETPLQVSVIDLEDY
jgi:hypothetical protein